MCPPVATLSTFLRSAPPLTCELVSPLSSLLSFSPFSPFSPFSSSPASTHTHSQYTHPPSPALLVSRSQRYAARDITGAPVLKYEFASAAGRRAADNGELWETLVAHKGTEGDTLMGCIRETPPEGGAMRHGGYQGPVGPGNGVLAGHAYAIMSLAECTDDTSGERFKLMKLRVRFWQRLLEARTWWLGCSLLLLPMRSPHFHSSMLRHSPSPPTSLSP